MTIDPSSAPLNTGSNTYDHSLLGDHVFNLAASWTNSIVFPSLVPLPAGVPTSTAFTVTITSVCSTENLSVGTVNDMAFKIENTLIADYETNRQYSSVLNND